MNNNNLQRVRKSLTSPRANWRGLHLAADQCILVVVDVQNYFANPAYNGSAETDAMAAGLDARLSAFRKAGVLICHVTAVCDTRAEEAFYKYTPAPDDLIAEPKETNSGFETGNLKHIMHTQARPHMLLAGCNRDYCVASTAHDGIKEGFNVYALEDLTGNGNVAKGGIGMLKKLAPQGLRRVSSDTALKALLHLK